MTIETAPAITPVASEPETASEFQAAAIAALESLPASEAVPKEEIKAETPKEEPKVEESKEEAPPEPLRKGFDNLARKEAALRKKEAEIEARLKVLDKYESAKTPMQLLLAKGWSYEDATREILKGGEFTEQKKEEAPNAVLKELQELKAQMAQERAFAARREIENKFDTFSQKNAEKYPFVAAKNGSRTALQYLQDWVQETGSLPADSIEESIAMSFQALNDEIEKQANEAAALLTKLKKPAINMPTVEKAVPQAESRQASSQKTLSNSMVSPGKPHSDSEPETAEDYRRLAELALEARVNR